MLLCVGCTMVPAVPPPDVAPALVPPGTTATAEGEESEYRLQRGDVLDIKFFYASELNESVTIRPDGRIALQLIGEVDALHTTPRELTHTLRTRYTGILTNPEITILIRNFAGQKVYVGGEVTNPGLIPFDGRLTLLQALVQVGWIKKSATLRNVVILRNTSQQGPVVLLVDVRQQVRPTTAPRGESPTLQPFDVVYVPQSAISKANDFVEQYLDKLLLTPLSRLANFSFVYALNKSSSVSSP